MITRIGEWMIPPRYPASDTHGDDTLDKHVAGRMISPRYPLILRYPANDTPPDSTGLLSPAGDGRPVPVQTLAETISLGALTRIAQMMRSKFEPRPPFVTVADHATVCDLLRSIY